MKKLFWVSIIVIQLLSCVSTTENSKVAIEYFNVANAFFELKQYDKSKEYFTKVLDLNINFHKARYNLVYILVLQEDFENAYKHIDYLESIDDQNLKIKKLLAYVKYANGNLNESLNIYLELIKSGDNSNENRLNVAKIYYQLNEYENSLDILTEILLEKEDVEIVYMAALAADGAEKFDLASQFYENCILLGKKDLEVLKNLRDIYISTGDYLNLKRIYNVIVSSSEKDILAETLFELAKIFLLIDNDFSAGYKHLESAIDAGFSTIEKIMELLNNPDLIEKEKIRLLFVEKKILND